MPSMRVFGISCGHVSFDHDNKMGVGVYALGTKLFMFGRVIHVQASEEYNVK
jgi:hypothetical protein